jgi:Ribbon-helix-helix protein, copG family
MKKAIPRKRGGKRPGAGRPATGRDPVTAVRLPPDLLDRLDAIAVDQGVSRSEMMRRILAAYVEAPKRKR